MMNQFLTLTHVLGGNPCSWTFAYNDVDGRRYLFCRNHSGRVHSFATADELTRKVARFKQIGYEACPTVKL